ncbi:MurR/RpiR family transcriptional regulator [Pantoea allii]|uniref:RpiR family transcriptional regulator n=1 Tax=Pantoea allii TaxID=574096 RepID=A0A2V2BJR4_9GAMM|nr:MULTISPECIES: MurR/RpiR family transcriptional regulator [Pantoea]MBW1252372.1 MurR/RpiR family transcriptional regulator [Pantoea allii]MBW1261651.1 MurR/RpiR family transcriptional regulator [Pantoea allii]MBW1283689.1 MurR/RpiR family transcriptional regulator [Pantoea allii]MCH9299729.1 MurR/RpiR family transcriptional regulator [Pantoea allii]MDJ0036736.1 MurR/RpiR family transcriptional regulator [Pantoea allii]
MFSHHDLATLNDLEMQVYQYIIKHRDSVSYMTIRDLAEQAAVSTTTVLRFCRKMQCEGWSEFRIRLRLAQEQTAPVLPVSGVADMLSFFKSINNDEFEQVMRQAAEMINLAERVFFIGVGTSGSLGKYGARFFSNVGKFSHAIDDPYYPVSPSLYENALAIILSVSGETEEVLRIASQFSLNKCKIIAITNSETCSLAKMSDFTVSYHVPVIRMADHSDITTQVPVMYIIESLGRKLGK